MSESPTPRPGRPGRGAGKAIFRALGHLKNYKLQSVTALVALLIVTAANLAAPQMVRKAIDDGLAKGDSAVVRATVIALIVLALGRGLFNYVQGYLAERASQGVAYDLREALFARIQKLSFSYYDQAQTGQLLTRLTNDVEQVRTFVGSGVVQLVASLVMVIGCAALMFARNATLAAVELGSILPIFYLLKVFVGKVGPLFGRAQMSVGSLTTVLQETLQGLKVVRAFSGEEREAKRYRKINQELKDINLGVIDAVSKNFPFVNFCANLGTLGVIGVGGVLILHQKLQVGEVIAFQSYLAFLLMPIMQIGFLAAMFSRAGACAQRVYELLDAPLDVSDAPDAVPLPPITGRVEFKDVRFRYVGGDRDILKNVSFVVEPGQMVAVLGTTGAGKSTITNLIPRFYDVAGGCVLVDGHDVRKVTLSSLRSQIGVVLQEALLFSGSVRDNIAYGRPDATIEQVRAAAEAAQAAGFVEELPEKYDTIIGERGVGLSGGQRQRLAIARALLTDPRLLILDDSTSAVDSETEMSIQAALDDLMRDKNKTAFVIAQRISTVRDADLILVLDDGKIAASGTHEELLATSRLYNDILGSQILAPAEESAA